MDITPVLLSQWRHKKRPVPFDKALQIEKLSDGKVSRIELCESDWHTVWPDLKVEAVSQ
jgi:DNA-binding transcriptional regulator YdaS (Cro superfamily)